MNNALYYHLYDSIVNDYLARHCNIDPKASAQIGLVVSSYSNFYRPLSFPQVLDLGLRVVKLGNSSVTYEIGVFEADEDGERTPAAVGGYTHVFVESGSRKSVAMAADIRRGLEKLHLLSSPSSKL